jgi:hypothetical protein
VNEVELTLREASEDSFHVGDRFGAGAFPTGQHLRACDDVAGTGVPGLLTGQLEQERFSAAEFDDRFGGAGLETDAGDAAQVISNGPTSDDEGLQRRRQIIIVDTALGNERDTLTPPGAVIGCS